MRALSQLAAFGTVIVAVLTLAGCPGPQPASREQGHTGQYGNVEETSPDPTHSNGQAAGSQDIDASIVNVSMDLLAKLGYDTTTLEVVSMELSPTDYSLLWNVKIGDELGIVADFNVNEETLRFGPLNCIHVREGVLAPSSLGPDDSPQGRIAEALGLEEEGYRFAVEKEAAREYRKYATRNEWQIAVSRVLIVVPADEDVSILLDWHENELMEPVTINIDRDAAISAALSFLDDSTRGMEPSHVELIQLPSEPYGPTDFRIYWEVAFGEQVVHVRADDGSILEAPQTQPDG